jgi:uncharacterized membrane protein YbaN (DUF454 family)
MTPSEFPGIILPGMPGTVFIIIAGIAFSRSHEGFYQRLKSHPKLGKIIDDFEQKKGMNQKAKIISITSIIIFTMIGSFYIKNYYFVIPYILLAISGIIYILKQKTSQEI